MDEYSPEKVSKNGRSDLLQGNFMCPKCRNTVHPKIMWEDTNRIEIKCVDCGYEFAVVK